MEEAQKYGIGVLTIRGDTVEIHDHELKTY